MSEWRNVALGDVITLQRGHDLPQRDRRPGIVPVISSSGISGYHDEAKAKAPGVVTGRYGTLGEAYYIEQDFWPHNTTLFVKNFHGNHPRFVYYLLGSLNLSNRSSVSAVPGLNRNDLHRLPVMLPPLPTQRRIAQILGRLDDKIEVNRRINRTLEAMAQALYRHHFIDFGPYQAGDFIDSELGSIPKGWAVSSLGDLFPKDKECVRTGPFGSNLHASDYRDEGTPLILVKHVQDGQVLEHDMPLVGVHKLPELQNYLLQRGDIVFTRVGVVGQSAFIHARQKGWMISGQMLRARVPDSRILNSRYLAQVFLDKSFIQMVEAHAVGSTRPSLNTQLLASFRFLVPPTEVQNQYVEIVSKWDDQLQNNREESRKLAEIRDYLLPRLLSGEIEVEG